MGPITILKLKSNPKGFDSKLVAEMWFYPDGSRILELSTKCLPTEAFDVAARWEINLRGHGVNVSGEQQTKTATALAYFSALLKDYAHGNDHFAMGVSHIRRAIRICRGRIRWNDVDRLHR
jgi:hypothetical protein